MPFSLQREEIKNRNSEGYNVLKLELERNIDEMERHFEQVGSMVLKLEVQVVASPIGHSGFATTEMSR